MALDAPGEAGSLTGSEEQLQEPADHGRACARRIPGAVRVRTTGVLDGRGGVQGGGRAVLAGAGGEL